MSDPDLPLLRIAVPGDVDAVRVVVKAAYESWIAVVGMRPVPLEADYEQLIGAGLVTVACPPAHRPRAGLIVLVPEPEVLLVENVAVDPGHQGR